ncbi:MAG: hypothetical protein ACI81R_000813 [Bradymonadia bacterium]|jgi:hypothetical protein
MSGPRILARALLCFYATLMVACAADPGGGVPEIDTTDRPLRDAGGDIADAVGTLDAGDATTAVLPYLEFVSSPVIVIQDGQTISLDVRLVGVNGAPIPDQSIRYDIDEVRAGGARLQSRSTDTDEQGIAGVTLAAGEDVAEFDVTVSAPETEGVLSIVFEVSVGPKDSADYLVIVNYGPNPAIRLDEVDVLLFNDSGVSCRDLPREPDAIFGAIDQVSLRPASDGTFDEYPYEAAVEDIPLTYAVAIAYRDDTPVGFACTDGLPLDIERGDNVEIFLDILELYPDIQGEFTTVVQFDLLEFLPPTAQTVIDLIGTLFRSPGNFVFDVLDETGVLERDDLPFNIDNLVAEAVDALVFALLPPEVLQVFEVGGDLYGVLRDLKMGGTITFFQNPNSVGALADCNELVLDDIILEFDSLPERPYNLREYGYQAAYGTFTGFVSVVDDGSLGYDLNVQQFGLEIYYGQIVVFLLEGVLFPELIEPRGSVTSLEGFVETFLDCEAISEDIGLPILEGVCEAAVSAVVGGIRDFLSEQTFDVGSFYLLSTPEAGSTPPEGVEIIEGLDWGPCGLTTSTEAGDFSVEAMGGPGNDRCVFDARFRTDVSDVAGRPVSAVFDGERNSTRATGSCGDGQ